MAQTFNTSGVNYSIEATELDDEIDTPDDNELAVPQRGGFKPPVEHYHAIPATGAKPKQSLDTFFDELLAEAEEDDKADCKEAADSFLDDLLSESVQAIEGKAKLKINRKKLLDTRVTGAERAAIEAENRVWELAREWKAVANVVIFNTQHCDCCGSQHSVLSGYFERQESRISKISRWQAVEKLSSTLHREAKHLETNVDICVDCAAEQDFPPEAGCTYVPSSEKIKAAAIPQSEKLADDELEAATDGSAEAMAAIEAEIAAELEAEQAAHG